MAVFLPIVFFLALQLSIPATAARLVVALYFVFFLYLLLHQTAPARNGIYRSLSQFLSRISYTLYVVHMPVAVFICAYVNDPWHQWMKTPKNLSIFFALNLVIVLFAYLFYLPFEANTDKVRRLLSIHLTREKHVPTNQSI
jgi:peptidoglycan/LPS O-acetylase OafA/YrhL